MFSNQSDFTEQTSPVLNRNIPFTSSYTPAHSRSSRAGINVPRTAALGLAVLVAGACAGTVVKNASAKKAAFKSSGKQRATGKNPSAPNSTPTTITYRVATSAGSGITPPSVAALVTEKPIPAPTQQSGRPNSASNPDCRVMPLGDSLTAFPDSYRGPLYRTLKAEGLKVDFVGSGTWEPTGGGDSDGEGHGGFRIGPDDGVDYQNKPTNLDFYIVDWLKAAKPQVILLAIGTNDLAAGGPIADAAAGKLQNLVAKIRQLAPDAYLVLSDIPPATNRPDLSPTVQAVDEVARKLGNGSDPKITYGEIAKNLLAAGFSTPVHTSDGTHFTAEGGVLFAKAWYPKARAAVKAACGI